MATPDPYISDQVTNLRKVSAAAKDVFFATTALRKVGTTLGYDVAITQDDLAGSNADLVVADIINVDAFYDAISEQFTAHPEQFQSLLKMARVR